MSENIVRDTQEVGKTLDTQSKLKKNIPLLIVFILSGSLVYSLPYVRLYYYDAFIETFRMTNTQAGLCGSYYGAFAAISYLIGGFISDKFSVRWLLSVSLLTTGITGFYLLTVPSPIVVALIHGVWGVTTIMTFWPALMKAIRLLASSNEQSKAFGFFEGGRGISNAIYMGLAVILFGQLVARGGNILGMKGLIAAYSAATTILGVLLIFLLRNQNDKPSEKENKMNFKIFGIVLKMPTTWLMIGIIASTYTMNMSFYYVSPYGTQLFGISTVLAAAISTMSQYVRPAASFGAGILGDKINSSKVMLIGQIIMISGIVLLLLTPSTLLPMLIISCIFLFVSMYICQSMHFAIMEESHYPPEISGTAIGIICTLGYLPESISPAIAGRLLDMYPGTVGYRYYFFYLLAVCVIGIVLTTIWLKITKEKRQQILEINKLKKQNI